MTLKCFLGLYTPPLEPGEKLLEHIALNPAGTAYLKSPIPPSSLKPPAVVVPENVLSAP